MNEKEGYENPIGMEPQREIVSEINELHEAVSTLTGLLGDLREQLDPIMSIDPVLEIEQPQFTVRTSPVAKTLREIRVRLHANIFTVRWMINRCEL